MTPSPAKYGSGIVSSRSRRLRTIAAILLVAIVAMAIYGMRVLVPGINHAASAAVKPSEQSQVFSGPQNVAHSKITPLKLTKKEAQVLKFDVLFEAAYWVVWIVLILSLMMVAWMDFREVSRTYLNQRRELWADAATATLKNLPTPGAESKNILNTVSELDEGPNPPVGS
jgi:hypothetical protein